MPGKSEKLIAPEQQIKNRIRAILKASTNPDGTYSPVSVKYRLHYRPSSTEGELIDFDEDEGVVYISPHTVQIGRNYTGNHTKNKREIIEQGAYKFPLKVIYSISLTEK